MIRANQLNRAPEGRLAKKHSGGVDRRSFLAGIGAAGAAGAAAAAGTSAAEAGPETLPPPSLDRTTTLAALEDAPAAATVDALQQCHGATGAGGSIGPSLVGESAKRDLHATIAVIKNPTAPMTKLYPGLLDDADVSAVAGYVQSLH
jgi:mono/diheme cytochrome c family protein